MSAQQLCFFKFERPLLDLLGVEFFRSAPAKPGVYLFLGEGKRVLYVGQSKNLRLRLSYYKNAQPEREPRRGSGVERRHPYMIRIRRKRATRPPANPLV